jgi:hypothetical protein
MGRTPEERSVQRRIEPAVKIEPQAKTQSPLAIDGLLWARAVIGHAPPEQLLARDRCTIAPRRASA